MPERILIRGTNWIGDSIMTLPAVRSIRRAYPSAKISILVKPSVAPIFSKCPDVDEVLTYEKHHKGALGKLRLAQELRKHKFTHAILLQNAFDAALIAWLARIPRRIGYDRDGRGFLLTKVIPYTGEVPGLHDIDYFLDMLTASGIKTERSEPWIHLDIGERQEALRMLEALPRPIVGLNPGAAFGSAKHWPAGRFASVAQSVITGLGGSVLVFGGPNETPLAAKIANSCTVPAQRLLLLAGMTTLRELMALIAACDVLVSNDSGPMHIGYAVRTPLVGIFGSTDPEVTGPVKRNGNIVLKGKADCAPCFERTCKKDRLSCMESISTEDVLDAVKTLLPSKKAVFFDRDGTLCVDAHFLNNWKDFRVFGDIDSLSRLRDNGFELIGVSNQSGIARGLVDEAFTCDVNKHFLDSHGFDEFYYCPHGPDEHCECRKPEPGMLLRARTERGIDLRRSWVVGDKDVDMLLARAVGARSILVKTGKQTESEYADFIANGLDEAVKLILSKV